MEPIVDWFNMMSYDLHGTWDGTNPYLGPFINSHTNLTEIDLALELMWRNDIDPKKVVMGTGFCGRSFTLADPSCKTPGCSFSGGGNPGRCSASAGSLMFNEITEIIADGAEVAYDEKAGVKMVTWGGNQWVSYDDEETLKAKVDFANELCLGGVMDDPSQCVWGECGANCPSGLVPVEESSGNKNPLGIELGCNQGKRNFCCPAKNPPTCTWKGSPKFCGLLEKNRCTDKEIEVSVSTDGCWTGHKSLCCTKTDSTNILDACKWFGAAPICSAKAFFPSLLGPLGGAFSFQSYGCDDDRKYPKELTKAKQGQGGQQSCSYNGGFKSFCCEDPAPWDKCTWRAGNTAWVQWEKLLVGPVFDLFFDFSTDCKTGCAAGETTVATDGWGCRSGTYSYFCCADPNQPAAPDLPDLNICYGPSHLDMLNSGLEEGGSGDKNVYEEENDFDFQCGTTGTTAMLRRDPSLAALAVPGPDGIFYARNATPDELLLLSNSWNTTITERGVLQRRGERDSVAMLLCGPNNQRSSIWVQNYPKALSILGITRKAWTVAKQGLCAAVGIQGLSTLQKTVDWVTEHVLEKQEFRNALQFMAAGKTATGAALRAGAVPFAQVFGPNGIFQENWPSANYPTLAFTHDWQGNINDFFTGLLGRTADLGLNNRFTDNLQVCDRDFNVYKEYMVAGSDFISRALWNKYSRQERVGILLDVVDMHSYRSQAEVVLAFSKTYANIGTMFADLTRYAATKGITYDFQDAWQQIMPDYLNWQITKVRNTFSTYLAEEVLFWGSAAAQRLYSPLVVADMQALCADLTTNTNSYLTLPVGQMAP
ncbi:chitinase [Microdochium nivale]|nr:chitinase [Microdochium nivale]